MCRRPGVQGGLSSKNSGQGELGTQTNERSLRLIGRGMVAAQRSEAYFRFPSGPQNLLGYRELRAWFRGRGAGWGTGQDLQAYLRVGSDSRNFYQYLTDAQTTTWLPEVAISLDKWRTLRAAIESRRLQGLAADSAARVGCGGDTVSIAYVLCDGPYLVHIENPAISPPNLAQVQEIAAGILRRTETTAADSAELWVDDIRLVDPISRTGSAMAFDARLVASDAAEFSAGFVRQDGYFQQIGGQPTYRTTTTYQLGTGIRLDRFLPASLGINLPIQVGYARSEVDPQLLTGTDIQGGDLDRLRRPYNWTFSYTAAIRRVERAKSWVLHGLIDPLSLSLSVSDGRSVSELSRANSSSRQFNASYLLQPGRTGFTLPLGGIVDKLPGFLRNTDAGRGLRQPAVTLTPSSIRLSSGLTRIQNDLLAYQVPVYRDADTLLTPILSEQHLWRNSAGTSWQPLGLLSLGADLVSTRDLRRYADSTSLGRLVNSSRRSFLGNDVGVERDRQLSTTLALNPRVTSWLRPRFTTGSNFVLSRSLTSRNPIREDGDTAGAFILPQTLNNTRLKEVGLAVDLGRLIGKTLGDSSLLGRATRRLRPFDISDRLTRSSTFDLASFDPALGYQLALGGLDSYLRQGSDTALGAAEVRATAFNSGADLPFGLSFTLGYTRSRTSRYQRAGSGFLVTESKALEWPRGSARFTRTVSGLAPISTLGFGASFRSSDGSTVSPSASGVPIVSRVQSSNFSPDAQIALENGMVFSFAYNKQGQQNRSTGSTSESNQEDVTAGFNHSFNLPTALSRVKRLVRSQLSAVISHGTSCLRRLEEPECSSVSDTRRREIRASLDSDLAKIVTGGLSFSYSLNEARHLDRKFSQIIITASLQLSLFAGDYR